MEKPKDYGPSPMSDPLSYPGRRPRQSFLFSLGEIFPIDLKPYIPDSKVDDITLERKLKDFGAASLSERHIVMGYGSNVNPAQLADKFTEAISSNDKLNPVVPILKGTIEGYDVVYGNHITEYGVVPATITASLGTVVDVWISLLDNEQRCMMNDSEGLDKTYQLAELERNVILENGTKYESYSYVLKHGALPIYGSARRVQDIPVQNPLFTGLTQEKILLEINKMLEPNMAFKEFICNVQDKSNKRECYKQALKEHAGQKPSGFIEKPDNFIPPTLRNCKIH